MRLGNNTLVFTEEAEDFTVLTPVTLTFSSGVTANGNAVCVMFDVIDDDIYEEDQEFNVSITAIFPPSAVVIGSVSSVTKTIRDNQGTYMCFGVLGKSYSAN